jgi:peptidoglycan/xylan/chitin deacetylase (PgdA/CDA1 family)
MVFVFSSLFFSYNNACAKETKTLILTFDDGPRANIILKLLEELEKENIKATFFVLGWRAQKHPNLIEKIRQEGHDIQNHGWSHGRLDKMSLQKGINEVEKTATLLQKQTGEKPTYFRPPFMVITRELRKALTERGYKIIGWDIGSLDWVHKQKEKICQQVQNRLKNIKKGTIIILFHETSWTVKAIPEIISYAKQHNWSFATLKEAKLDAP